MSTVALVTKQGRSDISDAIERGIINAEIAKQLKRNKKQLELYDMSVSVQNEIRRKRLAELEAEVAVTLAKKPPLPVYVVAFGMCLCMAVVDLFHSIEP